QGRNSLFQLAQFPRVVGYEYRVDRLDHFLSQGVFASRPAMASFSAFSAISRSPFRYQPTAATVPLRGFSVRSAIAFRAWVALFAYATTAAPTGLMPMLAGSQGPASVPALCATLWTWSWYDRACPCSFPATSAVLPTVPCTPSGRMSQRDMTTLHPFHVPPCH